MSLPARLLGANPSIQVSTLLSGSLTTPSAKGAFEPPGDFQSIATVSVGSGGTGSISFTSIPSTFKHLQVRGIMQTNRGTYPLEEIKLQFNSDTGSNYNYYQLAADGQAGSVYTQGATSATFVNIDHSGTSTGGTWGIIVLDILDYTSTAINKTVRGLAGYSHLTGTTGGYAGIASLNNGLWRNNSTAISSMTFAPRFSTLFTEYTHLALYGVKA